MVRGEGPDQGLHTGSAMMIRDHIPHPASPGFPPNQPTDPAAIAAPTPSGAPTGHGSSPPASTVAAGGAVVGLLALGAGCAGVSAPEEGGLPGGSVETAMGDTGKTDAGPEVESAALDALRGAQVGGTTGALIGRRMDEQAERIDERLPEVNVERIREGILVTFDDQLLFDFDERFLRPSAEEDVQALAEVLTRSDDTRVLVVAHTDATGPADYNQELSLGRARDIARHVAQAGVGRSRIETMGQGESQPIASNDTPGGRQMNRRVEIAIYAGEELKERMGLYSER